MTAIAERLDQKLKMLPPARAASVARLVSDGLEVVDGSPLNDSERAAAVKAHQTHIDQCLAMAAELDWSDFQRPEQGVSETRED